MKQTFLLDLFTTCQKMMLKVVGSKRGRHSSFRSCCSDINKRYGILHDGTPCRMVPCWAALRQSIKYWAINLNPLGSRFKGSTPLMIINLNPYANNLNPYANINLNPYDSPLTSSLLSDSEVSLPSTLTANRPKIAPDAPTDTVACPWCMAGLVRKVATAAPACTHGMIHMLHVNILGQLCIVS